MSTQNSLVIIKEKIAGVMLDDKRMQMRNGRRCDSYSGFQTGSSGYHDHIADPEEKCTGEAGQYTYLYKEKSALSGELAYVEKHSVGRYSKRTGKQYVPAW